MFIFLRNVFLGASTVPLMIACAGDNGVDNQTQTQTQAKNAETVSPVINSSGCLVSSNADLVIDYLMGDKQSQHLVWRCPSTREKETHFYAFDYNDQCYKEAYTLVSSGCDEYQKAPETPLYNVVISEFSGNMYSIGGGMTTFNHTAIAENTGNIYAFGVHWELKREPNQILKSGTFEPIRHGNYYNWSNVPFIPVNFSDIGVADTILFTFTLRSYYGDLLDTKTIRLTNNSQ